MLVLLTYDSYYSNSSNEVLGILYRSFIAMLVFGAIGLLGLLSLFITPLKVKFLKEWKEILEKRKN